MSNLTYHHLSKRYGKRVILDELSLSLQGGRCTLLTGKNGTGKTTLMRILAGLEKPERPCQVSTGTQTKSWLSMRNQLQQRVMYLHQHPYMFQGTVHSNLEFALPRSLSRAERQQQLAEIIEWAGLDAIIGNNAKSLSGGECQQVAIARARLRQPQALLLDEPTANMDTEARQRTLTLLARLREEQIGLLVSSHDPMLFRDIADQRLHLARQRLTDGNQLGPQQPPINDDDFRSGTEDNRQTA